MKILLKDGLVFDNYEKNFQKKDILINNEKIEKIEKNIELDNTEKIYCRNKYIIPGGIDVHTHLDHNVGNGVTTIDDFQSGTKAALYGGTTSIIDHVAIESKEDSINEIIKQYHKKAKKSYIDYSFHGIAFKNSKEMIDELSEYNKLKISSVKIYTVYNEKIEDKWILELFKNAKKNNITVCIHCENEEIINYSQNQIGNTIDKFSLSRPIDAEAEMVERLIYYAKITNYPKIYFVHISAKESLEIIIEARKKGHKNLFVETCTQYLTKTDDVYKLKDGGKYICSPPLRKSKDIEFLWKCIEEDNIDVIASDHCAFDLKYKLGIDNYKEVAGGVPGIEERLLVVLSEAYRRGIEMKNIIDKLSVNPAQIFNLDSKGKLEVNKDADIVILEKKDNTIKKPHGNSEYSIYEDILLKYKVDTVISRGSIILKDDVFLGKNILGKYIYR